MSFGWGLNDVWEGCWDIRKNKMILKPHDTWFHENLFLTYLFGLIGISGFLIVELPTFLGFCHGVLHNLRELMGKKNDVNPKHRSVQSRKRNCRTSGPFGSKSSDWETDMPLDKRRIATFFFFRRIFVSVDNNWFATAGAIALHGIRNAKGPHHSKVGIVQLHCNAWCWMLGDEYG